MADIHGNDGLAAVEFQPASESAFDMDNLGVRFSNATIDAWVSIREGLQSADFEFAALAESGDESTREHVLVGVGLGAFSKAGASAGPPQDGCVVLYAEKSLSGEAAVDYVKQTFPVSAGAIKETRVRVEHTGPIELLSAKARHRPAPGGVSLGHGKITGTLGCLCRGTQPPRDRDTLVLSNNHVLADSNFVLQPGPKDGGKDPGDLIGKLERFVPVHPGGATPNWVDCATARVAHPGDVRPLIADFGGKSPTFIDAAARTVAAWIGLDVRKAGRTTGLTDGFVDSVRWAGFVKWDGGPSRFVDQIAIKPSPGSSPFSQGGDSGSLVWTASAPHGAVGLLFAGNRTGSLTLANPIDAVLSALDISLI